MQRKKKLILNMGVSFLHQLVTFVCGFILPSLFISHYGSATNGLVSSITQFLAFFSMMEMGVGAVVRASLYKPLAEKDDDGISKVLISSKQFFTKIGILLCAYSAILVVFFPTFIDHTQGYISTAVLVFAIAFNSICQYLFGIVYQQLLTADQKGYIQHLVTGVTIVANTVVSVLLIHMDASIQLVKIASATVMLIKPLILKLYVDKHYHLNFKIKLEEEPLKQKWNGLAQHIATYVLKHADTVILTLFSTLENVSIYYVYHLVTNGLQQIIEILTTGMSALLGDMYARNERQKLQDTFSTFEWIIHSAVVFIFSVAGITIIPFVMVYTEGVSDTNYVVPLFAVLIILANATYCLRVPYSMLINSIGHFKETQISAIVEAALNVIISIILVFRYGLVGVAIGTMIAMTYRTIYLSIYIYRKVLHINYFRFIKRIVFDCLCVGICLAATQRITMVDISYWSWIVMLMKVGLISVVIVGIMNMVFYREQFGLALKLLGKRRKE